MNKASKTFFLTCDQWGSKSRPQDCETFALPTAPWSREFSVSSSTLFCVCYHYYHDFEIMRLTRCRLRHSRVSCLLILRLFCVSVTIVSVITKFSFLSKTKNTQMNCFHLNICCICHPLFARLRYNPIFFIDWF